MLGTMEESPTLSTGLRRGAVLRCPRCGSGGLFRHWTAMADDCPGCGLHFEQEQGYWLGSVMVNTGLTQGLFLAFFVVGMIVTWPDVPWTALLVGGVALTLLAPVFLHPFTRTLWVATERHVRRWSDVTPSRYPRPIQDRISNESTDDTVA
jgi:uncharacterized protein (DUF983 family)